MSEPNVYRLNIHDGRGIVVGEHSTIYQIFADPRYAPLAHVAYDFTTYMGEKTASFVGRAFAFDALDRFMREEPAGYFVIQGEPGIGKSAFAARLVQLREYVHHFNRATIGITRADRCLVNICAQLIARYKLDYLAWLPDNAAVDGAFLDRLLWDVSRGLADGERAVIALDALDELDWPDGSRANILYLPETLPPGIFVVATTRPRSEMVLPAGARTFLLDKHSAGNRDDVLAYIRQYAERPGMQTALAAWHTTPDRFAALLLDKSEGNFMYLRHVLPAIEGGRFRDFELTELPDGLLAYYETHWRQMRAADLDEWEASRQPVLCYLAAAVRPVTVGQIAEWVGLSASRVRAAINAWLEFLNMQSINGRAHYSLYHASFQQFLAAKEEARELDLQPAANRIFDSVRLRLESMQTEGRSE